MTVLPPAIFVLLFDDDCREPLSALLVVVLPDKCRLALLAIGRSALPGIGIALLAMGR
jgi:hypothetical protein